MPRAAAKSVHPAAAPRTRAKAPLPRTELLEAALAGIPAGIAIFDAELRLVHANPQMAGMLEFPAGRCGEAGADGRPALAALLAIEAARGAFGPDDPAAATARRLALARDGVAQCDERVRADGSILELRGVPLEGGGYMIACRDVTEARRSEALIVHMAQHDPLTGLPNRILFADRLDHAIAQVRRGGVMAVHYLDLDAFKPVNDSLGHQGGDELLTEVAARMRSVVRESDTLARLGGDEFGLVQTGIRGPADAAALARRMISVLAAPYTVMGRAVRVGVSGGIALAPLDGLDRETLLRRADLALYRAKRDGTGMSFYSGEPAEVAAGGA